MGLYVSIYINWKNMGEIKVINVSEKNGFSYGKGKQIYKINDFEDKFLEHVFEDGFLSLTKKAIQFVEDYDLL